MPAALTEPEAPRFTIRVLTETATHLGLFVRDDQSPGSGCYGLFNIELPSGKLTVTDPAVPSPGDPSYRDAKAAVKEWFEAR